jgi:hypothetical protein
LKRTKEEEVGEVEASEDDDGGQVVVECVRLLPSWRRGNGWRVCIKDWFGLDTVEKSTATLEGRKELVEAVDVGTVEELLIEEVIAAMISF